jgi:hypothetical protein
MLRIEKFDKTKTYMFVDGSLATPEVMLAKYPAIEIFPHVLELNGDVIQAVMNLSALKGIFAVDEKLTEEDAIIAIETKTNTPPPVTIDATERLAAAQEFANLMTLDTPLTPVVKDPVAVADDPYAALVKANYDKGLWSAPMVAKAVEKGAISAVQHDEITTKTIISVDIKPETIIK